MSETFRLAYVPGATPGKWAGVWRERLPEVALELVVVEPAEVRAALTEGRADAAIARLPVDTDVFSRIPLYEEVAVVCLHRDHLLAALDEGEAVTAEDLADEPLWLPQDDVLYRDAPGAQDGRQGGPREPADGAGPGEPAPGTSPAPRLPGTVPADPDGVPLERPASAADALAIVASGSGVTVLPLSLARLHHRKDIVHRPLEGGPRAPVGLVWPAGDTGDLVEEMIGIVRGRTVNSSRGRGRSAQVSDDDDDGGRAGSGRKERSAPGKSGGRAAGKQPGGGAGARRGRPVSGRNDRNKRRKT
ncbi:LysR family transcriptional regulator substrate-binding protein [Myceligenerans crystallogenes]|uniref:LysR substrate-binding domain-containing protein n=1 Tax=Myceligenerans crystallogenes TaxID=316335 RepID=A0ABN2NB21_9MICO